VDPSAEHLPPGPSHLWVAKFIANRWQSRVFASLGTRNHSADVAVVGRYTFVTWARDTRINVASNRLGVFASHTFNTPGSGPKVAGSTTPTGTVDHIYVTWAVPGTSNRVFFAETTSNGLVTGVPWEGSYIIGPRTGLRAVAIASLVGKATVIFNDDDAVYTRAQI
jgi:hypothetical protein